VPPNRITAILNKKSGIAGAAAILAAMVFAWAVPRLETLFITSPLAGSGFFLFHIAAGQAAAVIGRLVAGRVGRVRVSTTVPSRHPGERRGP